LTLNRIVRRVSAAAMQPHGGGVGAAVGARLGAI
jgi:hypothetical protein